MVKIQRTSSENPDFKKLVELLDADLAIRDGEDHAFYAQFNKMSKAGLVVGCLAWLGLFYPLLRSASKADWISLINLSLGVNAIEIAIPDG